MPAYMSAWSYLRRDMNTCTIFCRLMRSAACALVAYTGHPGGAAETDAVTSWATALHAKEAEVAHTRLVNHAADAPQLIVVEKG